jgi:hypothetical protein
MTPTIQIPISITVLAEVIRTLSGSEKILLKQLLDEEVAVLEQMNSTASSNYPLRGLPLIIAEDFDEPVPELWEALNP